MRADPIEKRACHPCPCGAASPRREGDWYLLWQQSTMERGLVAGATGHGRGGGDRSVTPFPLAGWRRILMGRDMDGRRLRDPAGIDRRDAVIVVLPGFQPLE